MQSSKIIARLVARQMGRRASSTSYASSHPVSSYNDLPLPQGCWKTQYDAKQRKYNMQLLAGVVMFTGSLMFGKIMDLWDLNWDIPETPATIDSYK